MSLADDFYLVDLEFKNDLVNSASGDLQLITGKKNALQALFNRLITVQGSLSHRPNYGVGVKLWQNKVASIGNQRDLALKIKSQFEQDFRVQKVLGVTFTQTNNGQFTVRFRVILNGIGEVTATFDPFGEIEI